MVLTEEYPKVPDYPPEEPPSRRWLKRILVGGAIAVPVVLVGGYLVAALALSGASLGHDPSALASLDADAFGGEIESAQATGPNGESIPLAVDGEKVYPQKQLHPGEKVHLVVTVKRSSVIGLLAGDKSTERMTLRAPKAKVKSPWISVPKDSGVPMVHFDKAVVQVAYGQPGALVHRRFSHPKHKVELGEQPAAGAVVIASAPRSWEHLGKFASVTWFPAGGTPTVAATPAAGSEVGPSTQLTLTFSEKVKKVLGGEMPTLDPEVPGKWAQVDAHTISFTPSGFGAPMATDLEAKLPEALEVVQSDGSVASKSAVTWHVPAGSELRLQQMLAQLGYMPKSWKADKGEEVALTPEDEVNAATNPPKGHFEWRYKTPPSLRELWTPGEMEAITQGALMMFQEEQGIEADGVAGPEVWEKLMEATINGERKAEPGYNYVYVSEALPETVQVWHNGKVVIEGPANTGIPGAETELGTFPVFEHLEETTMSGENPDGSHYEDPGIMWVSYFNGGDALHAFDRASFGTPQSLGCVEMPLEQAADVYPYTPIGTLVTVAE